MCHEYGRQRVECVERLRQQAAGASAVRQRAAETAEGVPSGDTLNVQRAVSKPASADSFDAAGVNGTVDLLDSRSTKRRKRALDVFNDSDGSSESDNDSQDLDWRAKAL